MDPILVSVNDRLANVGDTVSLVGHLDLERFELSERSFLLPSGMDYDVVLSNVGEGILATGILRARAIGTCDRCLDEAVLDVAAEVDEYYLFSEPEAGVLEDGEEEGPDYTLVSADSTIDLSGALSTAFVMDIPYVVLCREDCAGLCPVCGENLNKVDCGHAEQIADQAEQQRMESSPFAALRNLKLDE